MAEQLTMSTFFDAVLTHEVTVVDFFAEWCTPCQQFFKVLPRLEDKLDNSTRVVKVDVDKEPDLKDIYNVRKVPTFVLLKNGAEVERLPEGKMPTLAEIESAIKRVKSA